MNKMDKMFKNTESVKRPKSKPDISVVFSSMTLQGRKGRYAGKKEKGQKGRNGSLVTHLLCGCRLTAPAKHTKTIMGVGEMAHGSLAQSLTAHNSQLRIDS